MAVDPRRCRQNIIAQRYGGARVIALIANNPLELQLRHTPLNPVGTTKKWRDTVQSFTEMTPQP